MFLEVQKFLECNSLEKLIEEFRIEVTEEDNLVILNYSQIEKELKFHQITKECRGLCLEKKTWKVVARAFPRFYNLTEDPFGQSVFNWENFVCEKKQDGSLALLYFYNGEWRMNTRASFAKGEVNPYYKDTWSSLFFEAIGNVNLTKLRHDCTYVFELMSSFNQVVHRHDKPKAVLLSAFENQSPYEYYRSELGYLGFELNDIFPFNSFDEIKQYLEGKPSGMELEGFVLRDINNNRIKYKNEEYLKLHRLRGNGNVLLLKNLVPLIISENQDLDEASIYFEDVRKLSLEIGKKCVTLKEEAEALWNKYGKEPVQKTFALAVKDSPYNSILFNARKVGFEQAWKSSGEFIFKNFFKG